VTSARSALWFARTRGRLDTSGLRILFYHRVADDPDELAVPVRRFREQMAFLADQGYRVLDVLGAADLLDSGRPVSKTIGLNFDDGFRDVAENALPVLEKHGFRGTVFVATGVTDGSASFAWYRRQPGLLSWAEIVELDVGSSLTFEAHTVTHPNLLTMGDQQAKAEIFDSKTALEDRLGRPVTAFCYPAGLFGERDRRLVEAAGYRVAVSCEPGVNDAATDRLALHRRQIDARDTLLDFRAKVGGGHDTPLPLRGLYRRVRFGEGLPGRRRTSPLSRPSRTSG
jgi:peptidoglycan/xylan/chitin deacetylase (PgdA/CDA1 family)